MFKFDYEYLDAWIPLATCIIPERWASHTMPKMGGNVVYEVDPKIHIDSHFIFEFSDVIKPNGAIFTISLDIKHRCDSQSLTYESAIDGPVKIDCRSLDENNKNEDMGVPIALLHHLLGFIPGSIPAGDSWLDSAEVLQFLAAHKELQFAFESGDDHDKIFSRLHQYLEGGEIAGSFPMMFVNSMVRLEAIDKMMKALKGDLTYAPSVNGDQTLVSWLFERVAASN